MKNTFDAMHRIALWIAVPYAAFPLFLLIWCLRVRSNDNLQDAMRGFPLD